MVLAHYVADDAGAFAGGAIGLESHLLHGVENAAVDGLESVADVGQSAADNDRHGIVEIRLAHLVFNVDGLNVESAGAAFAAGRWRGQGEFGILIVWHGLGLGSSVLGLGLLEIGAKRLHLQAVNGNLIEKYCSMLRGCGKGPLGRLLIMAVQVGTSGPKPDSRFPIIAVLEALR